MRDLRQICRDPRRIVAVEGGSMRSLWLVLLLVLSVASSACDVIGDIFQAGMAVGIIVVILIVAVIGFLVSRLRR
jgi:hypothetical protein